MARDPKDAFYRTLKLDKNFMKAIKHFRDISKEMKKDIGQKETNEEEEKDV